ncbi:ESPR-type extended signal peptide-containing protein, partial [Haemophilus haemolyticus]|uniref:ESPR-type extended signal peptide-containing protein n=1 Tax=Haemophilus haemolyticus TaxID=726 RepID=UPI00116DAB5E
MNNIFKIIWNKTTQRIEVVSELAKGAVKASSGSHQSKSIAIKSTLKLSLLSLCLGYTNEAMALTTNIDGNTTFQVSPNGGWFKLDKDGKYAVGVYDKDSASFAFGYAQAGHKEPTPNEPAAVGNKQLAIGNDNLTSSGHSSIAIGSNVGDNSPKYKFAPNDGTKFRKGGAQGMYTVAIGAGMQAIGRNVVAIGRESGNGGAYNGYDDAVYLGSYSRINPKGQGQDENINTSALEDTYTTAVKNYNRQNNETNLNAIINAGRAINNVALNKVDAMTLEYNITEKVKKKGENNKDIEVTISKVKKDEIITPLNQSAGDKTVSILSIGGKIPKPGIQKPTKETDYTYMYRQIQNVAAGRMSADSFDAVNGSQLYYVRNYTGWNIGHNSDNKDTVTGRVNNDHTVIFKANGNYVNVSTTLDSTNKSTVNIGVNTSDISVTANDGRITAVTSANPANTVATTTSVKEALETFDKVKADKVDIMGYSHVNTTASSKDDVYANTIVPSPAEPQRENYTDKNTNVFNQAGYNTALRLYRQELSKIQSINNDSSPNHGTYADSAGSRGNRAITSGVYANALAEDSIAIGSRANVNNNWGNTIVQASRSIAIGREAQVNAGQDSLAMGTGAQILRSDTTGVSANNSIAIGKLSKIDQASNAIALGNNASISGADGSSGTWKGSDNSIAIGNNSAVKRENSVAIGTNATATRERVVAIGALATANGDRTVAIGPEATANGSKSIVIGGVGDDKTDGKNFDKATSADNATQAIVIGNGAQAKAAASYSITLGNSAKTEAVTGISIGDRANVASGANSGIALGKSAVANKSGDIAIGESSSTSAKHTVSGLKIGDATLSTGVAATDNGTVSFGNNTIKRQIQNVGAGEISDTSSDVITGSQLYHVIKAADEIAKTEYKFKVNGNDIKTMSNKGTSAVNNVNNTLDFKAGDGLDVAYENNAVTYKLNADSKNSIIEAKNAAKTVTTKLNEINQSVARAEAAAGNAANSATEADKAKVAAEAARDIANTKAGEAATSATAAAGSAKTASDKAAEAAGSAQTATDKAAEANSSAEKAKASENAAATSAKTASDKADEAAGSAQTATDKAAEANSSAEKAKASENAAA